MTRITRSSKKEDIWLEKERLDREALDQQRRIVVLERELDALKKDAAQLKEKAELAEKLRDELRASSEKLALLTRLTRDLASFDQENVLRTCVERIPYLVGARRASLYLYDPQKKLLTLKQHTHERPIDPIVDVERTPNSLMAQAVKSRTLLHINDLESYKREDGQPPARPHKEHYRTRSCMVAPLIAAGDVLGVLNLADRLDDRPFTEESDLDLVRQAADLLAVSLRNARLFDEVQRASRLDSLTGLLNHRATAERLDVESKRATRYGHDLSLVVVFLEELALLAANHGPRSHDGVIEQAAKLVRSNVRDVDIAGRLGADELAVILPEQNLKGALVVGERLARIFKDQRFRVGEALHEVRATVGIVQVARGESAPETLARSKEALERARKDGQSVGVKS